MFIEPKIGTKVNLPDIAVALEQYLDCYVEAYESRMGISRKVWPLGPYSVSTID